MKRLLLISTGFLISTHITFSQSDTVMVSNGVKDSIDMKYDRIYKLFLQDKGHDVRHLWKVDMARLNYIYLNAGYEQKIGKNWSNETYLVAGMRPNIHEVKINLSGFALFDEIKYYYNLHRREKLGKNTCGFSGNYFAIGGSVSTSFYYGDVYSSGGLEYNGLLISTGYQANFGYGLQRRIGNIGFIEAYAGIRYSYFEYSALFIQSHHAAEPEIGLKLGFAIESFRELKRALK